VTRHTVSTVFGDTRDGANSGIPCLGVTLGG
jgi:hypothetical protein